jgi:hypothetical protein
VRHRPKKNERRLDMQGWNCARLQAGDVDHMTGRYLFRTKSASEFQLAYQSFQMSISRATCSDNMFSQSIAEDLGDSKHFLFLKSPPNNLHGHMSAIIKLRIIYLLLALYNIQYGHNSQLRCIFSSVGFFGVYPTSTTSMFLSTSVTGRTAVE